MALGCIYSLVYSLYTGFACSDRVKDLSSIAGVRSNQLIGYGLVVGLDGTGDSTNFTNQSFKTLLSKLGVQLPPGVLPSSKNIAAVSLHAELPAFAKPGQQIDVTVSSIGSAKSLRGGTLLISYLKGIDGNTYAVAQGNLVVGGFGTEGKDGSQIKINVPVVGRIPNGATVEVAAPNVLNTQAQITLLLNKPDFTTAQRMAKTVNEFAGMGTAQALDAGSISVYAPIEPARRVEFIAALENLILDPGDAAAKIIVNSRTGTIVVGKHVVLSQAAVTHGSLTVTITEEEAVSQPAPGAQIGTTGAAAKTQKSSIQVTQPNSRMFLLSPRPLLEDLVQAVNQVGAAPGDLMAILDALKRVGALRAELEVI
ncbi:MAG: flagellar basal body P-ring protein FlgI [Gammaproteobacteria bacterium]